MPACLLCVNWIRPETGHIGRCGLDAAPAHSNYHCKRYQGKPDERHLGLTPEEIAWLNRYKDYPAAKHLINLYGLVLSCPSDPGARGVFAAALGHWRARNSSHRG